MTTATLALLLLAGAAAGAWGAYFRWKDKAHPEPLTVTLLAIGGGALAVGGALLGYRSIRPVIDVSWEGLAGPFPPALAHAAAIGVVEEAAKALPVLLIARLGRHFDEPLDGFVYAGAAGIGFALVETVLLSFDEGLAVGAVARALTSPITHALFAAPWGYGLSFFVLSGRVAPVVVGFVISAATHGAYDLLLSRPSLHLAAALLVAGLWAWMLRTVLVLQRAALKAP
ncbi:MAG: PrsW family intramembrane metalloprotease [Myxococcota bacterium]